MENAYRFLYCHFLFTFSINKTVLLWWQWQIYGTDSGKVVGGGRKRRLMLTRLWAR